MKNTLRTLAFALVGSLSGMVAAQSPFWIRGHITVDNCYFAQSIAITQQIYWGGTGNPTTATSNYAVLPSNCSFTWQEGGYGANTVIYFTGTTQCGGLVLTAMDSAVFTSVPDTIDVHFSFGCSSSNTPDCLGVPNGNALPGTACTTALNQPGTWNANCVCEANAPECEACFTTAPLMGDTLPIPFSAVFNNCSSGGTPLSYMWTFPGGIISEQQSPTFTFPGPGQYQVCLTFTNVEGCISTVCNDVLVNAFGGINTVIPDPPYPLIVHVDMTMCDPGTTATISTGGGAQPPYSFTVALDADCSSLDTLWMSSPAGSVSVTLSCDPLGSETTQYFDFNLGVSGLGFYYSGCPNQVFDCLQIPNGPNMPGTPCENPLTGEFGTWNADCECVLTNPNECQAGFWVIQAYEIDSLNPGSATPIPYELWVWNLSTGTSPFQFEWDFGDGTSSTDAYPTHVYGNSGPYLLCLTMSDATSCTSLYCDSVSIDGDGYFEGMVLENAVRSGFTIRVLNQLPTGIEEQPFFEQRLWPNPVTENMSLSFRSTVSGTVPLSIIDLNGRVLQQDRFAFMLGDNRIDLSASHLVPGMYVLRIGSDSNAMNIRFVKH